MVRLVSSFRLTTCLLSSTPKANFIDWSVWRKEGHQAEPICIGLGPLEVLGSGQQ
ncbi:hypothetical protein Psta_2239 [Pirellula staleyi DSM 6068]|uniref:Uncharacterized protein n=1 Tax=Pirellula staleyi (strain ATCC 27377 / DSM 6068 / ICPB 4128) TaxID=530564 RepID=D2R2S0_PIRSD|nr:hypothetical protein Psta_2239 [Pirellula staleyi DSM 6068]